MSAAYAIGAASVTPNLLSLLYVFTAAATAPLLAALPRRVRIPSVVVEIALGILIGPQVLGLATADPFVRFLSAFGLAFLFFLAGLEIEIEQVRGRPLKLASWGWLISFATALAAAVVLDVTGLVSGVGIVAIALATTAMGTLMPILKDAGELESRFGTYMLGVGVAGEFFPLIAMSLFLAGSRGVLSSFEYLVFLFVVVAIVAVVVVGLPVPKAMSATVRQTLHASGQLGVRLSVLVLGFLVYVTTRFDFDYILGAFAAGLIVGAVTRGDTGREIRVRLEGIGFGFLVPVFFVVSGMQFDLDALLNSTTALVLLPVFLLLLLLTRGVAPLGLYREGLDARERRPFILLSATGLPIIVAVTGIGVSEGKINGAIAASLVGAGMLSVLLFPSTALALRRRGRDSVETFMAREAAESGEW